jgi:hypothetical protein
MTNEPVRLEKKTTANRVVDCLLPGWTVIPQTEARWTVSSGFINGEAARHKA